MHAKTMFVNGGRPLVGRPARSATLFIQVMTDAQAKAFPFNPFDLTKIWPKADFPLIEVGFFELNRNPENVFAEVEQAAFSPANVVPGISFSPDKMLQARLFPMEMPSITVSALISITSLSTRRSARSTVIIVTARCAQTATWAARRLIFRTAGASGRISPA